MDAAPAFAADLPPFEAGEAAGGIERFAGAAIGLGFTAFGKNADTEAQDFAALRRRVLPDDSEADRGNAEVESPNDCHMALPRPNLFGYHRPRSDAWSGRFPQAKRSI